MSTPCQHPALAARGYARGAGEGGKAFRPVASEPHAELKRARSYLGVAPDC